MSFLWPYALLSLLATPLLVLGYLRAQRRREQLLAARGALGLVQNAAGQAPGRRRHLPYALLLVGVILLCLALARPEAQLRLPHIEGVVLDAGVAVATWRYARKGDALRITLEPFNPLPARLHALIQQRSLAIATFFGLTQAEVEGI